MRRYRETKRDSGVAEGHYGRKPLTSLNWEGEAVGGIAETAESCSLPKPGGESFPAGTVAFGIETHSLSPSKETIKVINPSAFPCPPFPSLLPVLPTGQAQLATSLMLVIRSGSWGTEQSGERW